jgi:hypothetical protein
MNFKPSTWKTIISIGVIIAFYLLLLNFSSRLMMMDCADCPVTFKASDCEKVFNILPPSPSCRCSCPLPTPISSILTQLLTLLFPGILIYIIWSLIQKKK